MQASYIASLTWTKTMIIQEQLPSSEKLEWKLANSRYIRRGTDLPEALIALKMLTSEKKNPLQGCTGR